MRTTFLAIVLISVCSALHANDQTVRFDGIKYQLAYVEVGADGTVTNEYVPKGESIDKWTTLLAVRYWPKVKKPEDAALAWLRMIQPLLTKDVETFKNKGSKDGNDLILEAWLNPPDHSYIEINLHRFLAEEGVEGVKAYQYAQKVMIIHGKGNLTPYTRTRTALFDMLAQLKLSPQTKKD